MPKYVIAGGQFTPFSYDEQIKPVQDSAQAHLKTQEALDTLAMQAGDIASQIGNGTGDNKKTAELYNNYMDQLERAGNDLYNNGYNAISARGLSLARQMYGRDITRIQHAIENRAKMAELYRQAALKDEKYLAEFNPAEEGLDKWLDNPQYGDWRHYSGTDLIQQGNQMGKFIANQLRVDKPHWQSILGGQYYQKWDEYGVTADEINAAVKNMQSGIKSDDLNKSNDARDRRVGMLIDAISNVYNSSKMGDWADTATRNRAYDYIGEGLFAGIAKPEDKHLSNKEYDYNWQAYLKGINPNNKDGDGYKNNFTHPYFVFGNGYVTQDDTDAFKKQNVLASRIDSLRIVQDMIRNGIDIISKKEELLNRKDLKKHEDLQRIVNAITAVESTFAAEYGVEGYKGIEINAENVAKALNDFEDKLSKLVKYRKPYILNGTATAHGKVLADVASQLGSYDNSYYRWSDNAHYGKKLSPEDVKAIMESNTTKFSDDLYKRQYLLQNPELGTISIPYDALQEYYVTVPQSLINSIYLPDPENGRTESVYDSLDDETKKALDTIVSLNEQGARVGRSQLKMPQLSYITAALLDDIRNNGDAYGYKTTVLNTLMNWKLSAIYGHSYNKHLASAESGDDDKNTVDVPWLAGL